jgi:hypothetical protein
MRSGIREFQPRQPLDRQLSSTTLNQILRELESLRITRVVNGTFRKLPGGTEIVVAPQSSGGGGPATTPQPWDLIARPDPDADPEDENPPYLIRVRPGTLSGFLATNWDIEQVVQSTGVYYAKAIVATDAEAITGLTIEIDSSPPAVQAPVAFGISNPVEYLFGIFSEGQVFRAIGPGNILLAPEPWITATADPAAAPGESPYKIYYRLQ